MSSKYEIKYISLTNNIFILAWCGYSCDADKNQKNR